MPGITKGLIEAVSDIAEKVVSLRIGEEASIQLKDEEIVVKRIR